VRVGQRVGAVGAAEHAHVGDRVVGLLHLVEVLLQAREAFVHDLPDEPVHAAEVRVHRHGRAAGLGRDAAGGQRLRSLRREQPGADLDQGGAGGGVDFARAHHTSVA
jgi:hypothetical protein